MKPRGIADLQARIVEGPIVREWVERAACAGVDPELFFPSERGQKSVDQSRAARKVCAVCPVRQECLDYAVENREQWGIFGGMNRDERRAYAKSRRVA